MIALCALRFALCAAPAATVITGTVTITNYVNITGTNAESITINSDTRIWTNAVHNAATQILIRTNIAQDAQELLIHSATHPFTGIAPSGDALTYVSYRSADDGALSITLTNSTWGYVTYVTNTIGNSAVVRVPYTGESAAARTNIANGLVDYLNLAAKTHDNDNNVGRWAASQLTLAHAALAVDSAATNFVCNFTGTAYQTITATNNVFFIQSTNRAPVRSLVIFIAPNGSNRQLGVNASWKKLTTIASVVTNGQIGILSLTVKGTAETDVYAAYTYAQ